MTDTRPTPFHAANFDGTSAPIGRWNDGPETFVIVKAKDVQLGTQTYEPVAAQPARVVDDLSGIRPPMRRISGVSQGVLERAARSNPPAAPTLFNGLTQAETDASASVNGLTVAPTPSQQADHSPDGGNMPDSVEHYGLIDERAGQSIGQAGAVTELARSALAAFEAKKAGA